MSESSQRFETYKLDFFFFVPCSMLRQFIMTWMTESRQQQPTDEPAFCTRPIEDRNYYLAAYWGTWASSSCCVPSVWTASVFHLKPSLLTTEVFALLHHLISSLENRNLFLVPRKTAIIAFVLFVFQTRWLFPQRATKRGLFHAQRELKVLYRVIKT